MRLLRVLRSLLLLSLAGMVGYRAGQWWERRRPVTYDPCDNRDGALTDESFVFVSSPRPGERVGAHFTVEGGASTQEGHLRWRLLDRAGSEIAIGKEPTGRGPEPEPFAFPVSYTITSRQIGQLEVGEEADSSRPEMPLLNTIPIVLHPPRS